MIDLYIFEKINNWAGKYQWLDLLGILFSWNAAYVLFGIILIFLAMKYSRKNLAMIWWALIAAVIARFGVTELVRFFYNRPRPFEVLDIIQLIRHAPGYSFPSGHMAFFFALSTVVFLYNRKLGWFFFATSALMGMARIYAGIHWPLDILAGIVVGIITAIMVNLIYTRFYKIKKPD